jgi:hypothetical protein
MPGTIGHILRFPATNTAAFVAFVIALAFITVMVLPKWVFRGQKPNVLLASLCIATVCAFILLNEAVRWIVVLAVLPPMFVIHQAIFLWLHKPREADRADADPFEPGAMEERARTTIESYYNAQTLFIRYGFPALIILIEGLILGVLLTSPKAPLGELPGWELFVRGARYGAVGAYTYVLLELGRRSFRHDLTGGIALWSVATIAIGPLLAGAVALMWQLKLPSDSPWQSGVVLFFAGFAPRRIMAAVEQAAMQLLRMGPTAAVETRTIPLTKVRGITQGIEERLAEEGIYDIHTLANAEPIRLVRNTSFDLRQILWWMDEALLMANLPRGWQQLEEAGISGAIDLGTYAAAEVSDAELAKLAELASLPIEMMRSTIQRLYTDAQIRYVWILYNRFTDDGSPAPAPPPGADLKANVG